jgi:hypothetical protein
VTIHPVVGYEGMYSVTEQGSVHNVKTGNVVRGTLYSRGSRITSSCRQVWRQRMPSQASRRRHPRAGKGRLGRLVNPHPR